MAERCLFFGCWNEPGHFLFGPRGHSTYDDGVVFYSVGAEDFHIDSTLSPERDRAGRVVWRSMPLDELRRDTRYPKDTPARWLRDVVPNAMAWRECPQGAFLRHFLSNGFSALSWWDRTQGDKRGACNSTILLEGEHDSATLLASLETHFPHVLANLERAGVELIEVFP